MPDQNQDTPKPKVDPRHLVKIGDSDFLAFEGSLEIAHQHGLNGLSTQIVQIPTEENKQCAIVTARVSVLSGDYMGTGVAQPSNVRGAHMIPHLLSMAETRAIARAFKVACNIGLTMLEEVGAPSGNPEPPQGRRSNDPQESKPLPMSKAQTNRILDMLDKYPRAFTAEEKEKAIVFATSGKSKTLASTFIEHMSQKAQEGEKAPSA